MEERHFGLNDRILRVNLSNGKSTTESYGELYWRKYLGGRNLIAERLLHELAPGTEPLGPENRLIFATGPVTGAPVSGSGRNSVGARSPLTGAYGDAEAGGFWGPELKAAGFDAVIIEGAADSPVYLSINDGQVEIRPAEHLWGDETGPVQEKIQQELGDHGVRVAQIGRAGERLVRIACVVNDLTHFYGRCGIGAVMGSKNLRAIAVRGSKKPQVADPAGVKKIAKWMVDNDEDKNAEFRDTGTAGGVESLHEHSGLPTRNFQKGQFEGYNNITGQTMRDTILSDRGSCYACIVRCKRVVKVTEPPFICHPQYGGPEYETVGALGSMCGIDNLAAVAHGNELCNLYGLDTIETGDVIAFAMECFERGILNKSDTDGLELRFGNAEAMVAMIHAIANRSGLGELLGEGVMRASEEIGCGSERYALHIKGQELPMHEPRYKQGLGLGYAVSPTGADHMHNMHDSGYTKVNRGFRESMWPLGILEPLKEQDLSPAKVRMLYYHSNFSHLYNSLGMCQFMPYNLEQMVDLTRAVTGWNVTEWELAKIGEKSVQLTRVFNTREGFRREDDSMPERFFEPFTDGPLAGVALRRDEFVRALDAYYQMLGWNPEGVPLPGRLYELGLDWLVQYLPVA